MHSFQSFILTNSASKNPSSRRSSLFTPAIKAFPFSMPALTNKIGAIDIAPIIFPLNFFINSIISSSSTAASISAAPGSNKLSNSLISIS